MNIATLLRWVNMDKNTVWDDRYYICEDYLRMAREFGIGFIAVMNDNNLDELLANCDGLIVPGSATNIDPGYYGRAPLNEPIPRDEYALDAKLMDWFISRNKPVLGICGGHQALNVFMGGTMKKLDDPANHRDPDSVNHTVTVTKGSFMYDVFQSETAVVNSYHNWELDDIAPGFEVVSRTVRDGVVEAFECKERRLFGTQWHPDLSFHIGDGLEKKFFENFLKCCAE